MKKLPLLLLILALALVACGGSEPTPTPVPPTAVPPTVAPTTESPGSYVDTLTHVPDPSLVNITWHWVRRDPNGNPIDEIVVPNPENYTLLFNEDGTFNAKVDCNQMNGRYATTTPGSIFMEGGAMTMAMCPEGSLDSAMTQMFGPAQNYRFEENGNTLIFSWAAGGPVDYYQNLVAPVEEAPGSMIDEMEHTPDPALIDKTWAWERRDPNGNDIPAITISNPENYTLVFNEDGTYNAKVDCNVGGGRYATTPPDSIFIEAGFLTMAFCGEESYDQALLQMFGPAQNYRFEEDGNVLVFPWVAGGPVDYYRLVPAVELPAPAEGAASGTVTAPDGVFLRSGPGTNYPTVGAAPEGTTGEIIGVSEDGQWWLANAPNLPSGQVWVSAQWVEASNTEGVPVVAASSVESGLTGTPWQWVSTTDAAVGEVFVNDPTRYLIRFNTDGTAYIQADCNNVIASYTTDGSSISIMPGPSTMMACPEDSQADQFMAQLSNAVIYFIQNGNLFLDMPFDSGTMRFVPQGTPPPAPDAPAAEAEGRTFYLASFGPADAPQPILEGTEITAHFANDTVSGNAGCNNYSGTVAPVDDYFQVTGIITTLMMCAEDVMAQEQAYLGGLGALSGYQWEQSLVGNSTLVTAGQLFYTLPDGTPGVMNFVATP
ncbi:MAG TPA: META domain-containing protein [Chloroflexota bacterium]|nr:META domain-containing protein [Chloroflexota bacterium]HUM68645.1 META domain-containing protein [Chloroflexota bacterium]